MPGGYVCSASYKGTLSKPRVKERSRASWDFESCSRSRSASSSAPTRRTASSSTTCSCSGPVNVFKLKTCPKALRQKLAVELWNYPDGTRILELSTKCDPVEAFEVAAETRAYLSGAGVELGDAQQTKTRTALEYFAKA